MRSYDIPNRDVEIFEDQQLGQGGFGTVYRGRWSGRDVAIKVLVCSLQGNKEDDNRSFRSSI